MLAYQLPPGTGPLSRANILIFSAGVLAGSDLPATSGFIVSTRSPLTGAIAHSWGQGHAGAALRQAGYDLLVLQGQSPEWCTVVIDGASVRIESASSLTGMDTLATDQALRTALGQEYTVMCIGPAGEAGVAYSSIVAQGAFWAEPAGTGVVMGHKRVKAIGVRGHAPVALADLARAQTAFASVTRRMNGSDLAAGIRQFGSNYYLPFAKEWGALTGRNGQEGRVPHLNTITRTTLAQRHKREGQGCDGCPLPCMGRYI